MIVAHSAGTVIITAETSNGKTNSVDLNINEIVAEKINIRSATTYMVGDADKLGVDFTPINTSSQEIQWESSDPTIATVGNDGLLKAIFPGRVTITAIQKDTQDAVQIQIKPIDVEEVRIGMADDFKGHLKIGEVTQFTATVLPENATYKDIIWSSSAPEIVGVDNNGIITAKAAGKADISAKTIDGTETIITVKIISKYHDAVIYGIVIFLVLGGVLCILYKTKQSSGTNRKKSKKSKIVVKKDS